MRRRAAEPVQAGAGRCAKAEGWIAGFDSGQLFGTASRKRCYI